MAVGIVITVFSLKILIGEGSELILLRNYVNKGDCAAKEI
jgi:hypothetical protein